MRKLCLSIICLGIALSLNTAALAQTSFSSWPGSPGAPVPGAVYWGVGGSNAVVVTPAMLGLPADSNIDGVDLAPFYFPEFVYFSERFGHHDPAAVLRAAAGAHGIEIPSAQLGLGAGDNIDALDGDRPTPNSWPVFFSVGRNDPSGLSPNDIYVSPAPGVHVLHQPGAALGLGPQHNLDALEVTPSYLQGNLAEIYFSVDRESGLPPAHIYRGTLAAIWRTGASMGIPDEEDLDALTFRHSPFPQLPALRFSENVDIPDHSWDPVTGANQLNVMSSFKVTASNTEDVVWQCIDVLAGGTGNDQTDIASVILYSDNNCDGQVNGADAVLDSAAFPADDGAVTLCPNILIPAGTTQCFIIGYIVSPGAPAGATYQFKLDNATGTGQPSGLPASVFGLPIESALKTIQQLDPCSPVCKAKCIPDGAVIKLCPVVVTCIFPPGAGVNQLSFYVQDPRRCAGIKVISPEPLSFLQRGLVINDLVGTASMMGCERVLILRSIGALEESRVEPLAMCGVDVGGERYCFQPGVHDRNCTAANPVPACATHNIGLFIQIWGCVTHVSGSSMWVDDGSFLEDGTLDNNGNCVRGIRVDLSASGAAPAPVGTFVKVRGVSSCYVNNGNVVRLVRVCHDSDLEYNPQQLTETMLILPGWNLVSPCLLPACEFQDPEVFFKGLNINNRLYRYDGCSGSYIQWSIFLPPEEFQGILPCRGYWLFHAGTAPVTIQYRGYNRSQDAWISLPRKGDHLIGNLAKRDLIWDEQMVTNICECYTMCSSQTLVSRIGYGFDAASGSNFSVGCTNNPFVDTNILECQRGYWYNALQDRVAVIQQGALLPID